MLADVKNETWPVDNVLKLFNAAGHQDFLVKDSIGFLSNQKDVT